MKRTTDIPGNAMGSQLEFERQMVAAASQVLRLERIWARLMDGDVRVTNINLKLADYEGGEVFVIVKAVTGDQKIVGFTSGSNALDAVRRAVASLENGSMKWREDKYE
jgi:hypothetical protein